MNKIQPPPRKPVHPSRAPSWSAALGSFATLLSIATVLFLTTGSACAGTLGITEVVTDPQADHSENAGGNGIAFDAVPGTGTISSSDEFIELYWAGDAAVDLTGYRLDFLDTSPSSYVFGQSTAGTLRFSSNSKLTALLPRGSVLLGNPPGALNNNIRIELLTPSGELSDVWDLFGPGLDGNATGPDDEAVALRIPAGGSLFHTSITPLWVEESAPRDPAGAPGTPAAVTPEPATAWLCALSVVAALLARRRTGRSACRPSTCGWPRRFGFVRSGCAAAPGCRDHRSGAADNA